jgi:hypothetical protein
LKIRLKILSKILWSRCSSTAARWEIFVTAFAKRADVGGLRHRIVRSLILVDPSGHLARQKRPKPRELHIRSRVG